MNKKDLTNKFKGDIALWIAIFFLCGYSVVAVYSGIAMKTSSAEYLDLMRHLFIIIIGLVLMWGVHLIKWHNALQKASVTLLIISWLLLILTIFFGEESAESKRRLDLIIFTVQASDIAKVMLIIYVSTIFAKIEEYEKDFKKMLKWVYAPVGITCALIVKDNNSTAILLFAIVVLLMFFARISMKKIATMTGIFMAAVVALLLTLSVAKAVMGSEKNVSDNRLDTLVSRVTKFFKPTEPGSEEYKAQVAISGGGLVGMKPGQGNQRYSLANMDTDYIFAIIVEEYGLLFGAIPIIVLFLILTFRGVKIALNSSRRFSAYLVLGITFMYVFQAFINIGVSVDCLPVTGQPMPFVSKGGSMFIMCCIAFGLVLSESRVNAEEQIAKELAEIIDETEITEVS